MQRATRLSNNELAEIQSRRPAVRASLACEGMLFTREDERLFDQMDAERLTEEDRIKRIIELHHGKHRGHAVKAAG